MYSPVLNIGTTSSAVASRFNRFGRRTARGEGSAYTVTSNNRWCCDSKAIVKGAKVSFRRREPKRHGPAKGTHEGSVVRTSLLEGSGRCLRGSDGARGDHFGQMLRSGVSGRNSAPVPSLAHPRARRAPPRLGSVSLLRSVAARTLLHLYWNTLTLHESEEARKFADGCKLSHFQGYSKVSLAREK